MLVMSHCNYYESCTLFLSYVHLYTNKGSWERKIVERVHNTRGSKKRSSEFDGPPAKCGRPKIDTILDHYPPYASNMEIGDVDHEQEMKDELGDQRMLSFHISRHLFLLGEITFFRMKKTMDMTT